MNPEQSSNTGNVFGMIGLGTMGRSLLLNIADSGFPVAGYDRNAEQVDFLAREGEAFPVQAFASLPEFVSSLKTPRAIMMLVPAGPIVDNVIAEILPLLEKGDILIDGGNSHFSDTTRRDAALKEEGLHFFGMGISGGEEGARRGPSMMPGGDTEAYQVMKPILEAVAAKVNGEPCVTYIGPGAAGHFVKMVHNGIEYGMMQLIAESYEIMRKGLQLKNEEIHQVFARWNNGRLQSYLLEITRDIFTYKAPGTEHFHIDDLLDIARSKGTGKWTAQVAMELEIPVPTIDIAVAMRDLSKYKKVRVEADERYAADHPNAIKTGNREELLTQLEQAFYFSMIATYAQGMHLLAKASVDYGYELQLDQIAKIWRGGCIIRAAFLEDIYTAYQQNPKLAHLLLDPQVLALMNETAPGMRAVVATAALSGVATPAFATTLGYFDNFRNGTMPSNLIQAQRDFFGAHTYEVIGKEGIFVHTDWLPDALD
ncbi:NADP-dependent phosphogluconate dehydrogenase [Pontibacter akesuensis]|uniref:6-phosphogluconate dehydrogenase, decarboxylating n=1 Tax=Pontibacter akesuensis TaxID=388950 RepID=A0A1I7FV45_9BACT|nr:NADP-dependent phosphogluconate dehydrogenase [Pontibacter akesuensis]GHA60341.1 6-phosphogluconate dehydrogenase, NADP(+)-dependent, decarboxylating [Pontibacter akesuensis]SFU40084.1 6-phosphogluconate dehydrogenase [Pontibacter akesuensis]